MAEEVINQSVQKIDSADRFALQQQAIRARMPELDGLRGLAIIVVIVHNAGLFWHGTVEGAAAKVFVLLANMGWVGVQLFFVISGFLITGILLDEKGKPRQLRNFFMRRVLRIFPLYFFALAFAFVLLPALNLLPEWLVADHSNQIWYWVFLINWAGAFGYSGSGLSHFWSLCVEEQFYLLWPLAVALLGRTSLLRLCIALIFTGIVIRAALIQYNLEFAKSAAYEFTVARWDALAIGALLALILRDKAYLFLQGFWRWLAVVIPVGYVLLYLALWHNFAPVDTGLAVINQSVAAIFFGWLVFIAVLPTNGVATVFIKRLLRSAALRTVGKYSYAMYVFHLPMIHVWNSILERLVPNLPPNLPVIGVIGNVFAVFILSGGLALVSWYCLEQPFLNLKRFFVSNSIGRPDRLQKAIFSEK